MYIDQEPISISEVRTRQNPIRERVLKGGWLDGKIDIAGLLEVIVPRIGRVVDAIDGVRIRIQSDYQDPVTKLANSFVIPSIYTSGAIERKIININEYRKYEKKGS